MLQRCNFWVRKHCRFQVRKRTSTNHADPLVFTGYIALISTQFTPIRQPNTRLRRPRFACRLSHKIHAEQRAPIPDTSGGETGNRSRERLQCPYVPNPTSPNFDGSIPEAVVRQPSTRIGPASFWAMRLHRLLNPFQLIQGVAQIPFCAFHDDSGFDPLDAKFWVTADLITKLSKRLSVGATGQ